MVDVTVVRYSFEGEKFEILVKPDPALDYKLGKKKDYSSFKKAVLGFADKKLFLDPWQDRKSIR